METNELLRKAITESLAANGLGPQPDFIVDHLTKLGTTQIATVVSRLSAREAITKAYRDTAPKAKAKKPMTAAPKA